MLDPETIDRLARSPADNAPLLNVALAEEGPAATLVSLARWSGLGPEALAVIVDRVARAALDDDDDPPADALDRLLIAHPNAPHRARDAVLERHPRDAYFTLAAACHPRATIAALRAAASMPAASAGHDRPWLALLDPTVISAEDIRWWSNDSSPLLREAAAVLAEDTAILTVLARDPARRVRRAVAGRDASVRAELARDPAPDVRARAAAPPRVRARFEGVASAGFTAASAAMEAGGVVPADVIHALAEGAPLDSEGALLAARVLPRRALLTRLDRALAEGHDHRLARELAAGLALRSPSLADHARLAEDAARALARAATDRALAGRARLAAWLAVGLARSEAVDRGALCRDLAGGPLGAELMVLGRVAALDPALIRALCAADAPELPGALLSLGWADEGVTGEVLLALAAKVARSHDELPERALDLDPSKRSLAALDAVVLAATARADVSPRAALAVVALDARRVRYVLAALPGWRGGLSGAAISRVLRQNAGALKVAQAEARSRGARVESWTERPLAEAELGVALGVGHVTVAEAARRIASGRQALRDGLDVAAGAEARAALEGAACLEPLLAWASERRAERAPALGLWLLLERFDRERTAAQIALAVDALEGERIDGGASEALAVIERRRPGRLEAVVAHTARGRATVASAMARAYRGIVPRE